MIKHIFRKIDSWMDYNPPGALSSKGWRLFKEEFKENAPIRFWIKNDFRYTVILPIKWKYEKITDWIRYRTIHRYHILNTGLPPGWNDFDTKMLHVNFNMLKDFVEVELAWRMSYNEEYRDKASWCEKHMPLYHLFFPFRNAELGIAHLNWAATLDDPALPPHERCDHQAVEARETLKLYKWWVEERPSRKDLDAHTYSKQGLGILASLDDDFNKDAEDFKAHHEIMEQQNKLEEEWKNEDNEMLIRLVRIRHSLWT